MRLVVAAAAAVLAATAAEAQPVSTAPLARNEILLEVDAIGRSQSHADRTFAIAQLAAEGATPAEARAALEAKRQAVISAARASGVPDNDIRPARVDGPFGFVGNEAINSAVMGAMSAERRRETLTLELNVRDEAQFRQLQTSVEQAGAESVNGPFYALADDTAARRAARADGVSRARAEAEAYARTLGFRVARIVRVSERPAGDWNSLQTAQSWMQRMLGLSGGSNPDVETQIQVSIDFALDPQ